MLQPSYLRSAIRPVAGVSSTGSVNYFERIDLSLGSEGPSGGKNLRLCSRDGRFVSATTNERVPEGGEEDDNSPITEQTRQPSQNM